jgi:levanase
VSRGGDVSFHPAFASVEDAPVELEDGRLALRVWVDRASVEVFAQGGLTTITDQVLPAAGADRVSLWSGHTRPRARVRGPWDPA